MRARASSAISQLNSVRRRRAKMWLLIPILIYSISFFYVRHYFIYWQLKGFPCEKSSLTLKFLKLICQRKFQSVKAISEDYKESCGEKFRGIYFFFKPTLLVLDVELAHHLLEKSERYFYEPNWDHKQVHKKFNLLEKIRPALTQDVFRDMFKYVEGVADNMLEYLMELEGWQKQKLDIDMEEIIRTYSNDIIGNLIYGLNINSFRFPDNIFNQNIIKLQQSHSCGIPDISASWSWLKPGGRQISRLRELLRETIKHRELQNTRRHDILQLLIKLRNSQCIRDKSDCVWDVDPVSETQKFLSLTTIIRLVEELMSIGLEAITTTIVHTLEEIIQQPLILNKILQEIEMAQKAHNLLGEHFSYEALEDLHYLDICIKETLRIHPGIPIVMQVCNRNYRIPGSKCVLGKGCSVLIPIRELQRDERYFKDPLLFKPERFEEMNGEKLDRAYFAFGWSERDYLAQHLVNVIAKMALTKLLLGFKLEPTVKTHSQDAVKNSICSCKINLELRRPTMPDLLLSH